MKIFKHLKVITKHKILVGRLCFKAGLYKQGLLHDLSKYSFVELSTGFKYFQGTKSPNSAQRDKLGYSEAWLHHKGRNKHHWEYWVDFTRNGLMPAKMPVRYVYEMLCDRVGASMIYEGKKYNESFPLHYYKGGQHSYVMHPDTRALLEELLVMVEEEGLDQTLYYIKKSDKKADYGK